MSQGITIATNSINKTVLATILESPWENPIT